MTSHTFIMWAVYAVVVALTWVFVSRTIAFVVLGAWVTLTLYGLAVALWKRREARH